MVFPESYWVHGFPRNILLAHKQQIDTGYVSFIDLAFNSSRFPTLRRDPGYVISSLRLPE